MKVYMIKKGANPAFHISIITHEYTPVLKQSSVFQPLVWWMENKK